MEERDAQSTSFTAQMWTLVTHQPKLHRKEKYDIYHSGGRKTEDKHWDSEKHILLIFGSQMYIFSLVITLPFTFA